MPFFSNFGCKIIFICSVNFWHQQDINSLFKGSIAWSCDLLVQVQDSSSLHLTFVVFCLFCVIRKQQLKEHNHCVRQSIVLAVFVINVSNKLRVNAYFFFFVVNGVKTLRFQKISGCLWTRLFCIREVVKICCTR